MDYTNVEVWCCALMAVKDFPDKAQIITSPLVIAVSAQNPAVFAEAEAVRHALELWPVSKGWSDHKASITKIDDAWIDKNHWKGDAE